MKYNIDLSVWIDDAQVVRNDNKYINKKEKEHLSLEDLEKIADNIKQEISISINDALHLDSCKECGRILDGLLTEKIDGFKKIEISYPKMKYTIYRKKNEI